MRSIYSLKLCPHVIKICRLTQKIHLTDTRWTKTSLIWSPGWLTWSLYWMTHFINIDGFLMKSNQPSPQENALFLALAGVISSANHQMGRLCTDLFRDVFCILLLLLVIFEATYVGWVHYDFVTLRIKHSYLILEHVVSINIKIWSNRQTAIRLYKIWTNTRV